MSQNESFKDHFSGRAAEYTRYRLTYPAELFAWLASLTDAHEIAWDCGCGNGQATLGLVAHYRQVIGTDASRQQIDNAVPHERIRYAVEPAEACGLDAGSVDLIVVAQAIHWFDFDRFYREVRRVARPGAVLAAISYGPLKLEGRADEVVSRFYYDLLGPYWPPERRHVDALYATIPFPFQEIVAPPFAVELEWDMARLLGYLGTWSAVKEYERRQGRDPIASIREELAQAWGDPAERHRISWRISLRVGRIGG